MRRMGLLAACVVFVACGRGGVDFSDGVPLAETVKLEVPGGGGTLGGTTGQKRQELQGDHSGFYDLTRGVTSGVNRGVGAVLGLVHRITRHAPTQVQGNSAIWGPHTQDLNPNTWKLTVTKTGAQAYEYKLEGKAKTAQDSAYVTVLSGVHSPAVDANGDAVPGFGAGQFLLDFDQAQTLPEHGEDVGTADVTYSRPDASSDTAVDVVFTQVMDKETQTRVDAAYAFTRKAQQGGTFDFSINKNLDVATSGIEHLTIRSRWQPDGAGRADVKATGGDLTADATANECWDSNFNSQYLATSWAPASAAHNYGAEQQDCAFSAAEYSNL